MDVPDIIGFPLSEASSLLDQAGLNIHNIKIIAPPRDTAMNYDDTYRVIRMDVDNENVVLYICKPL